jgi:hypothetical protein
MNFSQWKKIVLVTFVLFFGISSRGNSAQLALPISSVTPGAINSAVAQGNIHSTICVSGYTKTIRPPASYTTKLKKLQLASSYSRYGSSDTALFEEDHLIPLELGGNPTDPKNLWPEPWTGGTGARTKDQLENALHALVCSDSLSLNLAQAAIANNWYAAYQQYVLRSIPTSQNSASPTQSSNFVMPMFYQNIGTVRATWGASGFINPPIVIQQAPPAPTFTCAPPVDSDIIIKQEPAYKTLVTAETQVTLTLLCHLQLISALPTPTAAVPTPTAAVPTPTAAVPTPTAAAPIPSSGTTTPPIRQCYVNGYITKTGKVVSGYYRSC